eukprot:CAMPEP_0114175638 /NCGR_PEP_ID=MMETSP0043_2-20121206/37068_1 /TAXON_ID=464988 /ORGANISM="Hemiselmis andersenii, Strain CCMP644" /LENGTH=53 /DNA_ID=CAMNT_0001273899 /DNA_START=536 /DNA_END=694 /DNA_ORIENTATION=+
MPSSSTPPSAVSSMGHTASASSGGDSVAGVSLLHTVIEMESRRTTMTVVVLVL